MFLQVFRTLLHQIISCCELLPCPNVSEESVTVFQFFNYIQKYNITQLGTHLTSLAKEGKGKRYLHGLELDCVTVTVIKYL